MRPLDVIPHIASLSNTSIFSNVPLIPSWVSTYAFAASNAILGNLDLVTPHCNGPDDTHRGSDCHKLHKPVRIVTRRVKIGWFI